MNSKITRITGDGMLLAIYLALSALTIRITPNLVVTFTALTIIIASVMFGWLDALIIAFIGSFFSQLTSTYGLSITTPLWMAPPIVRALLFGITYDVLLKKGIRLEDKKVWFFVVAIIVGLIVTLLNTGAIYLDAIIFEYPVSLAIVESIFRFVSSILSSIVCAVIALPALAALKKGGFNRKRYQN